MDEKAWEKKRLERIERMVRRYMESPGEKKLTEEEYRRMTILFTSWRTTPEED